MRPNLSKAEAQAVYDLLLSEVARNIVEAKLSESDGNMEDANFLKDRADILRSIASKFKGK